MSNVKVPFKLRLKVSLNGLGKVFRRPAYILLGTAVAFLALGFVVYITNLGLLGFFLFQGDFTLVERAILLLGPYKNVIQYLSDPLAAATFAFAVLAGINAALYVYVRRHATRAGAGKGAAGLLAGVVGAGCGVCGTSIVAPLLASAGATASASLTGFIGTIANLLGVVLLSYSIYRLGQAAAAT